MNETIIVKSKQYRIFIFCAIIVAIVTIIPFFFTSSYDVEEYNEWHQKYLYNREHLRENEANDFSQFREEDISYYKKEMERARGFRNDYVRNIIRYPLIAGLGTTCLLFVYWWLSKGELTVTSKRVYGRTMFGKRVDLPMDSISSVGTGFPKTIAVHTSSGAIKFALIANRDEIHEAISKLLLERQEQDAVSRTLSSQQKNQQSTAEELKKYKELLDMGVITEDEFVAKKTQLLGL